MLTVLLYALLAIALAGGLFLLAARFLPAGEQIAPPLRDEPPWELPPERALSGPDIDSVRLPVSLRGYRFAETDLLLDRLAAELRARDAEIARLRGVPLPDYGGDDAFRPPADEADGFRESAAVDDSAAAAYRGPESSGSVEVPVQDGAPPRPAPRPDAEFAPVDLAKKDDGG